MDYNFHPGDFYSLTERIYNGVWYNLIESGYLDDKF